MGGFQLSLPGKSLLEALAASIRNQGFWKIDLLQQPISFGKTSHVLWGVAVAVDDNLRAEGFAQ